MQETSTYTNHICTKVMASEGLVLIVILV